MKPATLAIARSARHETARNDTDSSNNPGDIDDSFVVRNYLNELEKMEGQVVRTESEIAAMQSFGVTSAHHRRQKRAPATNGFFPLSLKRRRKSRIVF